MLKVTKIKPIIRNDEIGIEWIYSGQVCKDYYNDEYENVKFCAQMAIHSYNAKGCNMIEPIKKFLETKESTEIASEYWGNVTLSYIDDKLHIDFFDLDDYDDDGYGDEYFPDGVQEDISYKFSKKDTKTALNILQNII